MSKRNALYTLFGAIGSAMRAADAVEGKYQPKARDLRNLGIDPEQFKKINR